MELFLRSFTHFEGARELRASSDEEGRRRLAGLAVPYGAWSSDLGGGFGSFRERIARGAFRESIAEDDILAVYNHDSGAVLGRASAGTLRIEETDRGVEFEVDVPDTANGRDVFALVERRDVQGNSFGFAVEDPDADQEWEEKDGTIWRTVKRAKMFELGPQPFPAYPQTELDTRAKAELGELLEQARRALGPKGMPAERALELLELEEADALPVLGRG